jgi:hypothetical protein
MKKKIVVCVFSVLIAVTVIGFVADAAATYAYEMDPANGVDIFEGFGAFIALLVGFFVVLFEADLFYTVYYFLFKPRTKAKSILNVLACSCWPLFFLAAYLPERILGSRALEYGISIVRLEESLMFAIFCLYLLLRIAYWAVSCEGWGREKSNENEL